MSPFAVTTAGLAAFTSVRPILYIPVVRTAELSLRQQQLWEAIGDACTDVVDYYSASNWVPHLTLAERDLDAETLGKAMLLFSQRTLRWTIDIDNVAFIDASGPEQELKACFKLRG
jgi:2'-5' RNA ligase